MSTRLKDLSKKDEILKGGHRLCAGCGASIAVRQILKGLPDDVELVVSNPTGCLEVSTTIYPYTSWNCSYIHSAFENVASTLSGVESAYRSLKKQGKTDKDYRFVVFAGDGGTYDIGFQALSGALERNHRMVYVCYNNEAYMNTGIQRSGATLKGAWTTTSPHGEESYGKAENRKDLTSIVAAHDIPYVAQASISNWRDAVKKAQKAFEADGPAFINILSPCHRGWRYPMEQTVEVAKKAVETCAWPLYEVENGEYNLTGKVKEKKPVEEYLKMQGRFAHLFKKEENKEVLDSIQQYIDEKWERIKYLAGEE
ncbi:thiamine pyrophosphate-dependent enzyme [Natranaerofaba carboxydovora]|uniref:thiamine pyrophosphate-dependent enzyme n=1 Tax=Natranaerofaba carboxydovora TaxID=2742683 RepID=UPI001F13741A|nr:thiamine pyrophosphate-dependent enzyme [Natranaerofaba carboxydovora]UMZ75226.1 Pyruvate synthase subunit PorB [Natranaerofaba carboxydovora]